MKTKKILILGTLDGFANSVRPHEQKTYVEKEGHEVEIINTFSLWNLMPRQSNKFSSFIYSFINSVCNRILLLISYVPFLHSLFFYTIFTAQMRARGLFLADLVNRMQFDLVICTFSLDSLCLLHIDKSKGKLLYDCPAPLSFELYYGGDLSLAQFNKFKHLETRVYKRVDYLCFQWQTYTEFIKKEQYDGPNIFIMNYGCMVKKPHMLATHQEAAKIVFIGFLKGYWVNLPLLSELCKLYPHLDVYGGPPPDPKWEINYKGYAPSTDVLKEYQFGLITFTDDDLRKHGFSSKHLEYISYGLPVLTPAWRKGPLLAKSSIYYTKENFLEQISFYSRAKEWHIAHSNSLENANELSWNNALRPLSTIIENL